MKRRASFLFVIVLFLISCAPPPQPPGRPGGVARATMNLSAGLQHILDTAEVSGCILVYDPQTEMAWTNDTVACRMGHLPASTFKIPNSIIALETGVMESDSAILRWNGEKRRFPEWEADLSLRDAFRVYFFATNIDPREAFDMKLFAKIRSQITLQALKSLNI